MVNKRGLKSAMDNRIDILNELTALSPLLASMEKVNVFTVPAGYFDRLGETVLMSVREETNSLLGSITNQPSMTVPQGYFESLADTILNKIKAAETEAPELNELSPALYSIRNKSVFAVPQDYFESLADTILNKVKTAEQEVIELKELSPVLYNIQNKNVFTVPQGYFESLADNILSKVTEDNAAMELKELSPLLCSVQSENVFTVPQGYFESLAGNILDKVKPEPAKVVTMKSRSVTTILKYAVAAMFTGVMALSVYKFTGTGIATPNTALQDPGYVAEGKKIKDVDAELAKIPDEDIIKYLQVNGSDADVAIVANTVDENELPTQDDYLTDDKALDKYLDNIDVNDLKN